jgi:protein-L-isoaspartate(D-aspartate) O-methyltransferase
MDQLRRNIHDQRVIDAMERVPREHFVPEDQADHAYDDGPLPIGEGQTISQPLIVAMMTEALALTGEDRVLEVGTGSGYQAAVLANLARQVVTVERFQNLAEAAKQRLNDLPNVRVEVAKEGILGWPDTAPYEAVIVTAAAPYVPQMLLDQVVDGGRIIIPVGPRDQQELLLVTRRGEGISRKSLGGCRFVPLIGSQAWPSE